VKHRAFSIFALAMVIVLGVMPAAAAPAPGVGAKVAPHAVPAAPDAVTILWNQYNNISGSALSSQNFEAAYDGYDDFFADDFVVPSGQAWAVLAADVDGTYAGYPGPVRSFNLFVYADNGGMPGALVAQAPNSVYAPVGAATFRIRASSPLILRRPGTYWFTAQANMDFGTGGQWYWSQRTVQTGNPSMWQNPNGAFGVCQTWGVATGCTGTVDPDATFRLFGVSRP
jgi:hypothetical protein